MTEGYIFATVDAVEISLLLFTLFFFGLIFYLQREGHREGFPLETDVGGRLEDTSPVWIPTPKTFKLSLGRGVVKAPNFARDTKALKAERTAVWPGAPYVPVGDPMLAGVGPGAYAERARVPDVDTHGKPRLAPLSKLDGFFIPKGESNIVGWPVIGADNKVAGTISDVWVDRMEQMIRYIEVQLPMEAGGKRVLAPMTMAVVERGRRKRVKVDAVLARQFANAPTLEKPDQITLYEEERACAYFGAGYLYATRDRQEPWI